jgi:hypothetical protein
MKDDIKLLYDDMQLALHGIKEMQISPVKRLSAKLDVIAKANETLKQYIAINPFIDQQDEINYFKYEKPLFNCEQFLAQRMFQIETKRKQLSQETEVRSYFEQELGFTRHYFAQHQFLYQYFQLEATELDSLLFIRNAETSPVILPEAPDLDPRFSTKGDYLFAKFIACERLQEYLTGELYPATEREKLKKALNWTGDKMNLVEIAYAIYDTAQINHGEIDIKDIIDWLEESLHISLSRYYRMFNEMKNRKSVGVTRYLNHCATVVQEHLTRGNEFRPQKPKAVSGSKSRPNK